MSLILISLSCLCATPDAEPSPGPWRFVAPPPGAAFEHPPLRAIVLQRQKPDDVVEKVTYRGERQRYGQLRFGSPSSVRVTFVLDELSGGAADLYVDANRNRRIERGDRVAGEDRTWRLPLELEIVEGETARHEPRAAIFRLGSTGLTFSYAAAGYLEGTVSLGGRTHAARRTDGDGNGLLTDPNDRVWIDRNDDGRWDSASEEFLFSSIMTFDGKRYAVRSDTFGHRLALEPLLGTGQVRLALGPKEQNAKVTGIAATLIGRDGSAVGLLGEGTQTTVPIGEYRLGTVTVSLEDPEGGSPWSFVFSDIERKGPPRWHKVEKDGSLAIDPIGSLSFATGAEEIEARRAGDELRFGPRLYTSDGLLIVTCYRGTPASPGSDSGPGARISLLTTDGRNLDTAHSGFA